MSPGTSSASHSQSSIAAEVKQETHQGRGAFRRAATNSPRPPGQISVFRYDHENEAHREYQQRMERFVLRYATPTTQTSMLRAGFEPLGQTFYSASREVGLPSSVAGVTGSRAATDTDEKDADDDVAVHPSREELRRTQRVEELFRRLAVHHGPEPEYQSPNEQRCRTGHPCSSTEIQRQCKEHVMFSSASPAFLPTYRRLRRSAMLHMAASRSLSRPRATTFHRQKNDTPAGYARSGTHQRKPTLKKEGVELVFFIQRTLLYLPTLEAFMRTEMAREAEELFSNLMYEEMKQRRKITKLKYSNGKRFMQ